LSGSCSDVCPGKSELDEQPYRRRQIVADAGHVTAKKRHTVRIGATVLAQPRVFAFLGRATRLALRMLPQSIVAAVAAPWSRDRDVPVPAPQSFRAWYKANRISRRPGGEQ